MKKTLLIAGISALSIAMLGQKNLKASKSTDRISEFKTRLYLSTAKDPMAVTQIKKNSANELAAKQLVVSKTFKKGNLKDAMEGKPSIDTTYTYPWDATNQQWDTIAVARMISSYDAQHNLLQYEAFAWNYDSQSWQDSVQFFYKYNAANKVLDVVQQGWQFDGYSNYSWVNVDHDIYTYNDLGQEAQFTYQYWDYENSIWVNSWQNKFTYDSNGNNTIILQSYWDTDAGDWIVDLNSINNYDSLNQVILNPMQVWDFNLNDWSNAFQYSYKYDSLGNNINMVLQTWNPDAGSWDNCMLQTMNYNSSNKIDNYLTQIWDPFLFDWYNSQRAFYKYDSVGNNVCIIGQDYDQFSNTWSSSWENLYNYNAQNKQISASVLYFDAGFGNWYSGAITKDLKIKKALAVKQTLASSSLEVYPNPASDYVNIRNSSAIDQVRVFDMLGNEIMLKNVDGLNDVQLDISNLKSATYLLNIKDSKGASVTKRIIKR